MSQKLQKLLADPGYAGIYHLPHGDRKALQRATKALAFGWLEADLGEEREIAYVLERIGSQLKLPDWYGANYDALSDCLSDLSWQGAWQDSRGYVMLLKGADELHAHDHPAFETLNEVLSGVIDTWRQEGIPFWVFYDLRADGLATMPTIATA